MRFQWDESKNEQNRKKHGVDFELATTVFEDEPCLFELDRTDESGEDRWQAVGMTKASLLKNVLLLVVDAYREDINGEEITRIISAREPGKYDIRRYQEQEMD